jgi:outer membrane PBP1 activator LpoA protein
VAPQQLLQNLSSRTPSKVALLLRLVGQMQQEKAGARREGGQRRQHVRWDVRQLAAATTMAALPSHPTPAQRAYASC